MTSAMNNLAHRSLENMLKGQLMTNGIHDDTLLEALCKVDRAAFVPAAFERAAYSDGGIRLCDKRFLIEPLVFAKLLDKADIQPHHHVLDIGAGLGYGSAVMSHLAKRVTAIESNAELVSLARKKLSSKHIDNVDIITAPLLSGCDSHKPYDRIIIEGAVSEIPEALEKQLADGGVLVAIKALNPQFATKKVLSTMITGVKCGNKVSYVEKEHVCVYPLHDIVQYDAFVL